MANVLDFSNDTEFVLAEQDELTRQARQHSLLRLLHGGPHKRRQ